MLKIVHMHLICFIVQAGKHEAIVKNVHDLLAKLAWDFSPEQLDHLFDCFKVKAFFFLNVIIGVWLQ